MRDNAQARRVPLLNELCEPGVVHVAAKIARLDAALPKTRHKNKGGDRQERYPFPADELERDGEDRQTGIRKPGKFKATLLRTGAV